MILKTCSLDTTEILDTLTLNLLSRDIIDEDACYRLLQTFQQIYKLRTPKYHLFPKSCLTPKR